jgi:hypothetical protein
MEPPFVVGVVALGIEPPFVVGVVALGMEPPFVVGVVAPDELGVFLLFGA